MVGKFTGTDTPACGFSIGFERIMMVLTEKGFTPPDERGKKALLLDKKLDVDALADVFAEADKSRGKGQIINIVSMKKNKKFQKENLAAEGYTEIEDIY